MPGQVRQVWPDIGVTVVILTGGRSQRLGRDKATVTVGGVALLDRLLEAIPEAIPVVIVGPVPQTGVRPVTVTREEPAGTGPVAAIAAALGRVATPLVVVAAVDQPFAGAALPQLATQLAGSPADVDAVMPVVSGHQQPLCAGYRTSRLQEAVAAVGSPDHRSVRDLVHGLAVRAAAVPATATVDVDTPPALLAARAAARRDILAREPGRTTMDSTLQAWVTAVSDALGIADPGRADTARTSDIEIDIDIVLDVAKDTAHGVIRPAAPVTTYLLGLAVAGGTPASEAAATISALAAAWTPPQPGA